MRIIVSFFFFLFIPSLVLGQTNGTYPPYNWRSDYRQAVPAFTEAGTAAAENIGNKEELFSWYSGTSQRLPEFLDDMVEVCAKLEQKPFPYTDIAEVHEFVSKWQAVFAACPDCVAAAEHLRPVVEGLFKDYPKPPERLPGELSTEYEARLFQFHEQTSPWGLSIFFHLEALRKMNKKLTINEVSVERTSHGVRTTEVKYRKVIQKENNLVKFYEHIENDKVLQVSGDQDPTTILHEALEASIQDGRDPEQVQRLQKLVTYIDQLLKEAWQQNAIDDFSYSYLYYHRPIINEMVRVEHPFFTLGPYYHEYKVMEYYPRDNMDEIYAKRGWEEYSPGAAPAISPRVSVKTTGPQPPQIDDGQTPATVSDLYIRTMQRPFTIFTMGPMFPLLLFSILGISNKIIGL